MSENWEEEFEEDDEENSNELVCPICGGHNPFLYIEMKNELYDIGTLVSNEMMDDSFLRDFVVCSECDKIVFPSYIDEITYARELIERGYSYTFITVDKLPETTKPLLITLFEEIKKYFRLAEQFYGDLVDMPQKDWDRLFDRNNENIPRVSIGEDVLHVFLNNGSLHIANNDGETRVTVIYKKSVEDTLEELKKPEVMKLIEEVLTKLKRENTRLEMHITVEKMIE
ncbi:MAG: hypothetical protein JHC26_01875 [Thermofilum sp.]|uniref:hypothetical protein n=1 Tax=Thermofilum sp. TaxID=1961369 RepID=UPI002587E234|nr:hypothetical protein [Thermofilum sp.]MCI4407811.1 hypothetical protein [Thermofilum sp.]